MILGSNIACDQISKNIVRQKIDYYEQINLMSHYITLTKVENSGAFLGLGDFLPHPLKVVFLIIMPFIFMGLAIYYLLTKSNLSNLTIFAICCMAGGGIGNLFDRLLYGSVTDFLHIDFILFQTGILNLADISLMMGTFMLVGEFYFKRAHIISIGK